MANWARLHSSRGDGKCCYNIGQTSPCSAENQIGMSALLWNFLTMGATGIGSEYTPRRSFTDLVVQRSSKSSDDHQAKGTERESTGEPHEPGGY